MEARARPLRDDGGDDDNLPSSDRRQRAMPSHTNPKRIPLLSPPPAQRALANFAHFLLVYSSFLPSFRPSTHTTARPPTDRPTVRPVRPRHQSSHHHHRTRSRLARSLARSMPTHTRRRSTAHARALLPDLRSLSHSLALARSLARLSHSLHCLLAKPAAFRRHRERGQREREGV